MRSTRSTPAHRPTLLDVRRDLTHKLLTVTAAATKGEHHHHHCRHRRRLRREPSRIFFLRREGCVHRIHLLELLHHFRRRHERHHIIRYDIRSTSTCSSTSSSSRRLRRSARTRNTKLGGTFRWTTGGKKARLGMSIAVATGSRNQDFAKQLDGIEELA